MTSPDVVIDDLAATVGEIDAIEAAWVLPLRAW
jgi:hypothetical protein